VSRSIRIALVVAIIGLGLAEWGKWEYSSALRWNPFDEKPIPKAKSAATFDFQSAPGVFAIDVELPMSEQEKSAPVGDFPAASGVACNLVFDLYAGNERISNVRVNALHPDGAIFSSHMDLYWGGRILIPRFGRYLLKVQNMGNDTNMAAGRLSLIREGNTENAAFLSGMLSLLVWAFGGMIVLIGILFGKNCWRKRQEPVRSGD
jgi:hypothetical protein